MGICGMVDRNIPRPTPWQPDDIRDLGFERVEVRVVEQRLDRLAILSHSAEQEFFQRVFSGEFRPDTFLFPDTRPFLRLGVFPTEGPQRLYRWVVRVVVRVVAQLRPVNRLVKGS